MTVACIGARDINPSQFNNIAKIGEFLSRRGDTIRSGNSPGSDQAFACGANLRPLQIELCLPWANFEYQAIRPGNKIIYPTEKTRVGAEGYYDAYRGPGKFANLRDSVQQLMARNLDIIEPSDAVIAAPNFNQDGKPTGGTAFGIFIAKQLRKPLQILDLTKSHPAWDICHNCQAPRLFWDCGGRMHKLKSYA